MKKILIVLISCIFIIPSVVNAKDLRSDILLYDGLYGEDVKLLQEKLNLVSFCGLKIDGIFGPLTDSCVRKFQEEYGLKVDGIAGYKTISKLNSLTTGDASTSKNFFTSNCLPQYVLVIPAFLNMREDAGTNSNIIDRVKGGTVYAVYGSKKVNDIYWYKINVNNKFGYISSRFTDDTFILVSKNNRRLSYYKDGILVFNNDISIKKSTNVGCYNLKFSDIDKDNNILNRLVDINREDRKKINNYIDSDVKIIVRD